MTVLAVKWIIMTVALYGVSFLVGGRVKFRGPIAALSAGLVIAPLAVFAPEINRALGIKDDLGFVIGGAIVYTAIALAVTEKLIPDVTVDNFITGLIFSAAAGGLSYLLFTLTQGGEFFNF